jgi:hypothetical protein
MKKPYLFIGLFLLVATFAFAQGHVDSDGEAKKQGIDITSLAIGAAGGLVGGYLLGARTGKKA